MAQLQKAIAQLMEGRQERPPVEPDVGDSADLPTHPRARVGADEVGPAQVFAETLLAKVPDEYGVGFSPSWSAAMAAGAFAFFRDRRGADLAVRVFTPRVERDEWTTSCTVIETALDDRPFIVDTVTTLIAALGGEVRLLLHPLFSVERGADGTLRALAPAGSEAERESFLHVEVANLSAPAALQELLTERLQALIAVTGDEPAMRARLVEAAAQLRERQLPPPWDDEREESAAWIESLTPGRFLVLGYREYDIAPSGDATRAGVRAASGLGLLRDSARSHWSAPSPLAPERVQHLAASPLLLVSKTAARSPIHRHVSMDDLAIKEVDAGGAVIGVRRWLGLFSSEMFGDPASQTPLLRRRLDAVLAHEGVAADSHDGRELIALFDSFPREELLASRVDDLVAAIDAIAAADATAQPDVRVRADAHNRGQFVLVMLPRARFSTDLQARVSGAVEQALGGPLLLSHVALDERAVARLHFHVLGGERAEADPLAALRSALGDLLRTWEDGLRDALSADAPPAESTRLIARYARALPATYKAATEPAEAAGDVRAIERLLASGREQIELIPSATAAPSTIKLFVADVSLALSDFVPVLEHLGLRVLDQDIVTVALPDRRIVLHRFSIEPAPRERETAVLDAQLISALRAVRAGLAADDALNALVTAAGVYWQNVGVLRAYVDYGHQSGIGARQTIIDALVSNPAVARALAAWFAAKFNPAIGPANPVQRLNGIVAAAERECSAALAAVPTLAHDRLLRAVAAVVAATVRTNAYAVEPPAALAMKLDATLLPHVPAPAPARETWVHGLGLQGIHLRAGLIARGGIRLSDRADDFRAEILALMRTQVVKNAIIVPTGAKGGFVMTGPHTGGASDEARAQHAYGAFIDALLSIADNRERGGVVPPRHVVRYDGDDPYLVVAADKGTTAFSDLANRLAADHRFWLADAFASGGSLGYDHKRLAITARGAWESARQHFRELGRDIDRDAVSVVGIGDMSGDVFGNGLLRSRHLRLVAAFDHRHVFLDPLPDPERALRERERLFALPHSSWADYAPSAFGPGGGVFPRGAKSISLTPEMRRMLGIDEAAPSGEAVVRAVLRLPVDLLWNGGIGTYIKASHETHRDAGDSANDAVRIDAREVRATVTVEGGNLGFTPAARVEYALAGGRINSDAIDNSAGVDCSDHEVNIKIALQSSADATDVSAAARARLLAELAEPVCQMVLAHNRSQVRAITHDQLRSRTHLAPFRDLLAILESEAGLDRQAAQLPTREALRLRRGVYLGLTRPELAMLLAATKLDLRRRLLPSGLIDDPALEPLLLSYFPPPFAAAHAAAIRRHPLRRDIVALSLTNQLIDTMGMTFLVRVVRDSGADVLDVVAAWIAAQRLTDAGAIHAALMETHERVSETAAQHAALLLADGLERATTWLVATSAGGRPLAATVAELHAPLADLRAAWNEALSPARREARMEDIAVLAGLGLPEPLAARLAALADLDHMLEIADLARSADVPVALAAAAYLQLGPPLGLDWLRQTLPGSLAGEDRWEPRAAAGLLEELRRARRAIANAVLSSHRPDRPIDDTVATYIEGHRGHMDTVAELIGDLTVAARPSLPALLVVLHELERLARGVPSRPWQ